MRHVGDYDVEDPVKIQGRDEVSPQDRSLAALRLQSALDALKPTTGTVLVLGCGAGRYLRALDRERPDLRFVGGDLSIGALREAQARDRILRYCALNAEQLPFASDLFSAVVFFDLLEHVPDYRRMLREISRVLRPEGILHFFVPLEGQPATIYSLLRGRWPVPIQRWKRDHVGHLHRFTSGEVIHAVWEADLRAEHSGYSFHLVGQVHDVIDYWSRERERGGAGLLPRGVVKSLTRLLFIPTWRLSYLEDRVYSGSLLAAGLHLTAQKT